MKIFYHPDLDGQCSAHIINAYDDYPYPSECFYPMQYGMELPWEEIEKGEKVFILDFSIEPEDMQKLLGITELVIWIDHHQSAIQKYDNFDIQYNIQGVRSTEMAGCCLAYFWVKDNSPYIGYGRAKPAVEMGDIPRYISLIGDRDTWTYAYGDDTKQFCAGMEALNTNPRSPVWNALQYDDGHCLESISATGPTILAYKAQTDQEYVRENGFQANLFVPDREEPYNCYAVNGFVNSTPFEAVAPDYDIWIAYRYLPGGYWTVSLYTDKDIDVSEIAKHAVYQGKKGGGHKGAAGFQCSFPPFHADRYAVICTT